MQIYNKLKGFYCDLKINQVEYMIDKISNMDMKSLIKEELEFAQLACKIIKEKTTIDISVKARIVSGCLQIFWKAMCDKSVSNDLVK